MSEMARIPHRFYEDHLHRDLPGPRVVKMTARHLWVEAHGPEADDLLSDARHHASEAMYMDPPRPGLAASARATVKALLAARAEGGDDV